MKIGDYILKERLKKNITVYELATKSGIPKTVVNKIERGKWEFPDPRIVKLLLQGLGK